MGGGLVVTMLVDVWGLLMISACVVAVAADVVVGAALVVVSVIVIVTLGAEVVVVVCVLVMLGQFDGPDVTYTGPCTLDADAS